MSIFETSNITSVELSKVWRIMERIELDLFYKNNDFLIKNIYMHITEKV